MANIYRIPDNFIDGGKLFGGIVKTRNFVEAVVLGGLTGLFGMQIPVTGTTKISIIICFCSIGFIPGLLGVNDGPLSTFLVTLYRWYKNKRIMIYNGTTAARTDSITDRMIEAKTSQESFSEAINKLKPSPSVQANKVLIEGEDFIFNTDEELSKYIEDAESNRTKHRTLFGKQE